MPEEHQPGTAAGRLHAAIKTRLHEWDYEMSMKNYHRAAFRANDIEVLAKQLCNHTHQLLEESQKK